MMIGRTLRSAPLTWLVMLLLLAACGLGCASGRTQRTASARQAVPAAAGSSFPGSAASVATVSSGTPREGVMAANTRQENKPNVQFASYYQDAAESDSQKSPSDRLLPKPPPEPIGAPNGSGLDDGRPALPLDLSAALNMAQGQNPRIAFAQAQISQAWAQYGAARVLWLPSLRAGMNYNKHEGRLQVVEGENQQISRGAAFGGLGANAVGASSPAVPGVYAQFHLTDAIYQRQITGYALDAREFQGDAVTNDQLLETALAYLALLEAAQRKAIAAETLENGQQLANLTGEFAKTGAGNLADADRATAALALLKNEVIRAEESSFVASARLTQLLSSDPALVITPQEPSVVPIDLVPLDSVTTGDLVAAGLTNRPELAASRSLVGEAVSRLRREEHAPWLPSVLLGVSYGAFGAGTGGQITNGNDRFDFDAVAWWELRNLGCGERAARDNARAQIQQARLREVETMDLVAREIVEAHAQVKARKLQIAAAQEGIAAAEQSYTRNLDRIRNLQGLPIEVLQSIQALDAARREYLRAVTDYNTAQFRLHRALGWPIGA